MPSQSSFDAIVSRICIMHALRTNFVIRSRIRKRRHLLFISSLSASQRRREREGESGAIQTRLSAAAEYFKKLPRGTRSAKRASHNGETVSRCALITWKAHYRVRLSRSERPSARVDRKIENGTFCPGVAGTAFRCALKSSSLNRPS